jgi:hypothetical protein
MTTEVSSTLTVDGGGIVGHWSGGVVLLHGGAKSGQWVG